MNSQSVRVCTKKALRKNLFYHRGLGGKIILLVAYKF